MSFFKTYSKNNNIKLKVGKNKNNFCFADLRNRIITLSKNGHTKKTITFAFFHEIGHFKCVEYNLFKIANKPHLNKYGFNGLTKKERLIWKKTILNSEKWCDDFGTKESNKYFKNPNCYRPYYTERGKKILYDYYKDDIKFK